jgi:hypothetical protein
MAAVAAALMFRVAAAPKRRMNVVLTGRVITTRTAFGENSPDSEPTPDDGTPEMDVGNVTLMVSVLFD